MRDILFNTEAITYRGGLPVRASSDFMSIVPFILEIGKGYDNTCLNNDLSYGDNSNVDILIRWSFGKFLDKKVVVEGYNYYRFNYTLDNSYSENVRHKKIYIEFAMKFGAERDINIKCKRYNLMAYTLGVIGVNENEEHLYTHANLLFINRRKHLVERYDPEGFGGTMHEHILNDALHIMTKNFFSQRVMDNNLTYKDDGYASVVCPIGGLQKKQTDLKREGFCVTWSCYMLLMKLLNPDMTIDEISNNIINQKSGDELLQFILRFSEFIVHVTRLTNKKLYYEIEEPMIPRHGLSFFENAQHYNETSTSYQIALFNGNLISQENRMNDVNALETETYEIFIYVNNN